jgi:hypothetical protein
MFKLATIGCAIVALAGMAGMSTAQAGYASGTRVHVSVTHRTVHPTHDVTHYRTITHTHYVTNVNRIVNVTRIQPIHHVTNVTRYLHHTVVTNSHQVVWVKKVSPPDYIRSSSIIVVHGPGAHPVVHTVYRVHTVNRVTYSTHVHNIWVFHHLHNIYRHITVVHVEPIVHVHTVTSIVNRTVALWRTEVVNVAKVLPAITTVTSKVVSIDP